MKPDMKGTYIVPEHNTNENKDNYIKHLENLIGLQLDSKNDLKDKMIKVQRMIKVQTFLLGFNFIVTILLTYNLIATLV